MNKQIHLYFHCIVVCMACNFPVVHARHTVATLGSFVRGNHAYCVAAASVIFGAGSYLYAVKQKRKAEEQEARRYVAAQASSELRDSLRDHYREKNQLTDILCRSLYAIAQNPDETWKKVSDAIVTTSTATNASISSRKNEIKNALQHLANGAGMDAVSGKLVNDVADRMEESNYRLLPLETGSQQEVQRKNMVASLVKILRNAGHKITQAEENNLYQIQSLSDLETRCGKILSLSNE